MTSSIRTTLSCALTLSLALIACDKHRPEGTPPAVRGSSAQTAPADPTAPAGQAAPAGQVAGQAAAAGNGVTGKILETMDSGGYTYLKLGTASGEQWAAVQQTKVAVGQTVTIADAMPMANFESTTLHRTFDMILFGALAAPGAAGGTADGTMGGAAPGNPHAGVPGAPGAGVSTGTPATSRVAMDAPLARAAGAAGRTIAEVHGQKAALTNKAVVVRGKVTKYNGGIMGKNWLHLQDGSGSSGKSDFDLVVTTAATAAVGDVVVARGTLHTDKDFGAGYLFDVIIEDATLEK